MKRVLIWHGKHEPVMFDATTDEDWAAASVACLALMDEWGFYYDWDLPTDPPMLEDIEQMPPNQAENAMRLRRTYDTDLKRAKENNAEIAEIKAIIAAGKTEMLVYGAGTKYSRTVPKAWEILQARSNYEYERVELEELVDPVKVVQRWKDAQ